MHPFILVARITSVWLVTLCQQNRELDKKCHRVSSKFSHWTASDGPFDYWTIGPMEQWSIGPLARG